MDSIIKWLKLFLFDLDDTLLETNRAFIECLDKVKEKLAAVASVDLDQMQKDFSNCLLQARTLHHVDPWPLWNTTLSLLAEKYPAIDSAVIQELLGTINKEIYSSPIPLKPGALELLTFLRENGVQIGIVTNASYEWTWFKLNSVLPEGFFDEKDVTIVPVNEEKSTVHWESPIKRKGLLPEHTIIIGDNYMADVVPALELGTHAVYLNDPVSGWHVHSEGSENLDSKKVLVISDLLNFWAELEKWSAENKKLLPSSAKHSFIHSTLKNIFHIIPNWTVLRIRARAIRQQRLQNKRKN